MQLHPRISGFISLLAAIKLLWPWLQSIYHECRLGFVVGLTKKRFSYAEFYVEGRKDDRIATTFEQLELILNYHMTRFRFPKLNRGFLIQMWCSRKEIRVGGKQQKIVVKTYWHY